MGQISAAVAGLLASVLRSIGGALSSDKTKNAASVLQSVATILAIGTAGWLYVSRYEYLARANMSHTFQDRCLTNEVRLIRAQVALENKGTQRLNIGALSYRWGLVSPLDQSLRDAISQNKPIETQPDTATVAWPELIDASLPAQVAWVEPGETQVFELDYFAHESLRTLELATFLEERRADGFGWSLRSFVDVEGDCP